MTPPEQLTAWLEEMAPLASLADVRVGRPNPKLTWATIRSLVAVLEGKTTVEGNGVLVRVGVTSSFPYDLPYVQIAGDDADLSGGLVAHVSLGGDICYTRTREMVVDPARPVSVLHEALERALSTLSESWTAPDNHEVLDEFVRYWLPSSKAGHDTVIEAYFSPDERLRSLAAWRRSDLQERGHPARRQPPQDRSASFFAVADQDDLAAPQEFDQLSRRIFGPPGGTALYLPLQASPDLLPPPPGRQWSPGDLRRIVRGSLNPDDLRRLDELLDARPGRRDLIVLGIPRPRREGPGRFSLVAVQLTGMRGGHALRQDTELYGVRLSALDVERRDRALVMQRGGSDIGLSRKRVLLLGCGALGGYMGFALAAAGVGRLALVDRDHFSLGNTFRHVLGRRFVGWRKVDGMARALQERFPYLAVEAHPGWTDRLLAGGKIRIGEFDLIVDATGDATHHLLLAGLLSQLSGSDHPPLLLTWLEALGLGGHTLTVLPGRPGCPRCLYSDPESPLFNVASFSAPGQELGHDELGCGSYHTPFADLDAIKTAEETTRIAVSVLRGQESKGLLRSWKGEPDAFLAAGHRLSIRFHQERRRHLRNGVTYAHSACPGCGAPA